MTVSRLLAGRPRRLSKTERRQAEAEAAERERKRLERVERDRLEREQQDAEDEEWDALAEEAWALTDQADMLGLRLAQARDISEDLFEMVREEVEQFLEDDPRSQNPYVSLAHLEGWLGLFGLDLATAKPLLAA